MTEKSRYEKGLDNLKKIDGKSGENILDSLQDISPELAKFIVEFPFGDIYARANLDLKSREVATIASLTTLGNAPLQLKVHIKAALNVGCSKDEIKEIILQMAVYAGFPAAINAMLVAKEVFMGKKL